MHDIKVTDVRPLGGDSAFLLDDGKTSILYDSGFAFTGYQTAENIKKVLGKVNALQTAEGIVDILKNGGSDEDAYRFFKEKYYHGYIEAIYPEDAMELNTSIMVNLIKNELLS